MENVCHLGGKWTYFTKDRDTQLSQDLPVYVGTYESSPVFNIDEIRYESADVAASRVEWIEKPTFLYFATSTLYYHWVMDDLFGLHWLLREYRQKYPTLTEESLLDNNIILLNRMSPHQNMLQQIFSVNPIKLLDDYINGINQIEILLKSFQMELLISVFVLCQ